VAGHHHGFISAGGESAIVDLIREARADVVLVAMGNGLQERWIGRLVPDAACSAYGVGALFDFLSGEAVRAPNWMRRVGMEWIFRLGREPRRLWRRYLLGNLKFLMRVLLARKSRTHVERKG
jgi:exopolysaccharide biosynthesis WecB/TagA/CpsF family protein